MKFKIDHDISSLFEDLEEWTYETLKKDIQKNGIQVPLIVAEDGTVVCGHQRYKIARELKIKPRFEIRKFRDKREMIEYAINDNLLRRQLNIYQKALVGLKLLEFEEEETRKRKRARTDLMDETSVKDFTKVSGRADSMAAKRVGISHVTLRKVKHIEENASEELKLKAKMNEITVEKAFLAVRAFEPKGGGRESFKPPRLKETKLLYPVKRKDDECVIATTIPADWYRGVRVTIEPLMKESLIAKAKREFDERQTEEVLEDIEKEEKEAFRSFEEFFKKTNAGFENRETEKFVVKKPDTEDSITMHWNGVRAVFKEEGKAKATYKELEPLLYKLPSGGKDRMEASCSKHELKIYLHTKSSKRLDIFISKLTEFFKSKHPEIKIAQKEPHSPPEPAHTQFVELF